jgi:hypothetical protein
MEPQGGEYQFYLRVAMQTNRSYQSFTSPVENSTQSYCFDPMTAC